MIFITVILNQFYQFSLMSFFPAFMTLSFTHGFFKSPAIVCVYADLAVLQLTRNYDLRDILLSLFEVNKEERSTSCILKYSRSFCVLESALIF